MNSQILVDIIRDDEDRIAIIDDKIDKKTVTEYTKLAKKRFSVKDKPAGTSFRFKVFPFVMDHKKQYGLNRRASNM